MAETTASPASSPPRNFHIFGSGISFSISPTIHNAGFQHYKLPFKYDIRESASIDEVAELIQNDNFGGGSVTMPHKLEVHKFCTEQTDTARLIGAINTLIVREGNDGRPILGDNTDWSGLYSIITDYSQKAAQPPTSGLVIGAGGASRAALYAMYRAGIKSIFIINRTLARAEKIKEDFEKTFEVAVLSSLQDLPKMPDVIIGTIPADVTTEDQFSSIFGRSGLCIEMAYKPRQTPLLQVAQRRGGWQTVTGLEVLLAQAYDQFYLWTGLEPPREIMADAVTANEREKAKKEKECCRQWT